MKRHISILSFLCLLFLSINLKAEVKLPVIFGDHMVLQQQTDAAIWGTATARSKVEVITSWNNQSYSTKADSDGK